MRITLLAFMATFASTVTSVKRGDYPTISIPGLDKVDAISAGSVGYQASSNMFSIDTGSIGNYGTTKAPDMAVNQPQDFGMASPEFNGPAVSYTARVSSFKAPELSIKGCQPTSNLGNCVTGGESTYGIALPRRFTRPTASR